MKQYIKKPRQIRNQIIGRYRCNVCLLCKLWSLCMEKWSHIWTLIKSSNWTDRNPTNTRTSTQTVVIQVRKWLTICTCVTSTSAVHSGRIGIFEKNNMTNQISIHVYVSFSIITSLINKISYLHDVCISINCLT